MPLGGNLGPKWDHSRPSKAKRGSPRPSGPPEFLTHYPLQTLLDHSQLPSIIQAFFVNQGEEFLAEATAKLNYNEGDDDNDTDCSDGGRIYGMRPISLLINVEVFSGLLSSILTPVFGIIVDRTPHRKIIGQGSAIILSIVEGIEISPNKYSWSIISVLQVVNFVTYNGYLCAVFAYTAELSAIPGKQTWFNSRFQTI